MYKRKYSFLHALTVAWNSFLGEAAEVETIAVLQSSGMLIRTPRTFGAVVLTVSHFVRDMSVDRLVREGEGLLKKNTWMY